jgi:hypothetical protein
VSRPPHCANQILARLPEADQGTLLPRLRSVDLARNTVLHKFGEPFSGIVSVLVDLSNGDTETATVGRDGGRQRAISSSFD